MFCNLFICIQFQKGKKEFHRATHHHIYYTTLNRRQRNWNCRCICIKFSWIIFAVNSILHTYPISITSMQIFEWENIIYDFYLYFSLYFFFFILNLLAANIWYVDRISTMKFYAKWIGISFLFLSLSWLACVANHWMK